MSSGEQFLPDRAGLRRSSAAKAGRPSRLASWAAPGLADWMFIAVLGWIFMGQHGSQSLLGDGDAGWHILLGKMALRDGALPATDPFSFSMAGKVWFAWEWLADVALGFAHNVGGLAGVSWLAAALIAATFALLFRMMTWLGVNMILAIGATTIACAVSTVHWLARPHLFTWLFLVLSIWLLEADRRKKTGALWLLVPLAAIWTNVHGGWVALIVTAGIFGVGAAAEEIWERWSAGDRSLFIPPAAVRYGALTLLCLAATLLNPYGFELHRHVGDYLQSDFILKHVQEFQSPSFRGESMRTLEITMFAALLVSTVMLRRGRFARPLLMAAWAHATLTSVRHAPLFMIIAAPYLALEATRLLAWASRRWSVAAILRDIGDDYAPGKTPSESGPVLGWLAVAGLIGAAYMLQTAPSKEWISEFPKGRFPAAAVDALQPRLINSKVLTSDQWGDYLIYRLNPQYRAFFDGRSDFYAPQIREDYIALMSATWDWQDKTDRYEFDSVLGADGLAAGQHPQDRSRLEAGLRRRLRGLF